MPHELIAVIDLGSNSAKLVLMSVSPDQSFKLIDELRDPLRLGESLDEDHFLVPAAIERTVEAAHVFAQFCRAQHVNRVVAVATSAMRVARNGQQITERIYAETGLRFEIISGDQEAFYDYVGVVNSLDVRSGIVFDVGGGSVQMIEVAGRRPLHWISVPLGAITLTTSFLDRDKISTKQIRRLEKHIFDSLQAIPWLSLERLKKAEALSFGEDAVGMADYPIPRLAETMPLPNGTNPPSGNGKGKAGADRLPMLVGLGGTVRNIAKIFKRKTDYPLDLLHGMRVPVEEIERIYEMVCAMSLAERRQVPGLSAARADIIVAGMAVVVSLARIAGVDELTISGRGLRDGLFLSTLLGPGLQDMPIEDPAMYSTTNLMHYYHVREEHAHHVCHLALSLFDDLASIHGLGAAERRLLQVAALLHDIGIAVSFYDHPAHAFYLLTESGIDGLTHRELVIVAYAIAAHSGSISPVKRWPAYRTLLDERDAETVAKVGAMLRLAESLDRSESGSVASVTCEIAADGTEVRIRLDLAADSDFELREARNTLPELERVFGVRFSPEEVSA